MHLKRLLLEQSLVIKNKNCFLEIKVCSLTKQTFFF